MPFALALRARWRVELSGPTKSVYLFTVSLIRKNEGPPYEYDDETWRSIGFVVKRSDWLWGHEVSSYEGDYHRYGVGPFVYTTGPW